MENEREKESEREVSLAVCRRRIKTDTHTPHTHPAHTYTERCEGYCDYKSARKDRCHPAEVSVQISKELANAVM